MKRTDKKQKTFLILLILVVLACVFFFLVYPLSRDADRSVDEDNIVYTPATDQEMRDTEAHKDSLARDIDASNNQQINSTELVKVNPVITSWRQNATDDNFEVNGYVDGIVETDGLCVLVLTKDGISVRQEKKALYNAQSTSCGLIAVPLSKLAKGAWSASIEYRSSLSQGVSDKVMVEVK